jgi:hypothetical protein
MLADLHRLILGKREQSKARLQAGQAWNAGWDLAMVGVKDNREIRRGSQHCRNRYCFCCLTPSKTS